MKKIRIIRKIETAEPSLSKTLREKIYSFMLKENNGVSSNVLARSVLKMSNVDDSIACQIIDPILRDDGRFEQGADGGWRLAPKSIEKKQSLLLCKIWPAVSRGGLVGELRCARLVDGQIAGIVQIKTAADIMDCELFSGETPILFDGLGNQISTFRRHMERMSYGGNDAPLFSLSRILKVLYPEKILRTESDISQTLNLSAFIDAAPEVEFETFVHQVEKMVEMLNNQGIHSFQQFYDLHMDLDRQVDFSSYKFDADFITNAPENSGVYIMRNKQHKVIYVGKAKNLKRRLKSYFNPLHETDDKLQKIRRQLYDIELIATGSELEALLLEYQLIAKWQPDINRQVLVHSRKFLERQRFPQIIFLPAIKEDDVTLLLFNPSKMFKLITISSAEEKSLDREIKNAFFSPSIGANDEKEDIAASWLSANHEKLSRIDMRMVTTSEEACRLAKEHIRNFNVFDSSIQV